MIVSSAVEGASATEQNQDFAKTQLERWCAACDRFLRWERDYILRGNPSPQQQTEHRNSLKWLLRFTRLLHATVVDPEFGDRSTAEMVGITLWKLEDSWKMIYEPMPEGEAVKLLRKVFPSEADQDLIKRLFPEHC